MSTLTSRLRRLSVIVATTLATVGLLVPGDATFAAAQTQAIFQSAAQPSQVEDLSHEEHLLLNNLDSSYIVSHIKYIEDNIGPGRGGSPAERHRANYLASQLAALGYQPWTKATAQDGIPDYLQEFEDSSVANSVVGSVTVGGKEYPANGPAYNPDGVYKGFNVPEVTGQTVYFDTLAQATAAPTSQVKGKVVLTNRTSNSSNHRTEYAAAAAALQANGASAVVFFSAKYTISSAGGTSSENTFSVVTTGSQVDIPVVVISYFDGQTILQALGDGQGGVRSDQITVRNARGATSVNVLAVKPAATATERTVIIGGHLDSVIGAIGANDNLSGTAVILGIAKAIQDVPTNYNIVFAFWGSEELGLRGSRHFYSSTLAPDEYWKNIVAYYNLDMAATSQTSNSYLTIHTPYRADGDSTKPLRSWAGDQVAEQAERYWAYANSNGQLDAWWKRDWVDPVTGQAGVTGLEYFGNCSDHASISGANTGVAFESAIPQVYTFWRDAGANSSTGDVTELNYHVVGDRLAWPGDPFTIQGESQPYQGNISPERAKILGSVYLLALVKTAQGPVYPQALDIETSGTKGRLRATWDAPNDGGSPITGYTLTLTPDAAVLGALPVTAQVPPSATSYTFDDLPVGDYTVKAVATNVIGRSPLVTSSVATVTAATVPDAPSVPVLTPGEASLGVTWQPPVDDGGSTLTEYVIKFSHGLSVTIPASSPLTFELTDLEPGDYSVTLSAVNSVGQSAEVSSATVAVLPISQVTSPAPASSTVDSTPGSQPGSTSAVNGTTALSFTGTANSWLIIAALALLVSGTFTLARKRRIASELA